MASILVISEGPARADSYALAFAENGFEVEAAHSSEAARERLGGTPVDAVVIDVSEPDGGTGMLVGQARAVWPDVALIALTEQTDMSAYAITQMGLWQPDLTLRHPIDPQVLTRHVRRMLRLVDENTVTAAD